MHYEILKKSKKNLFLYIKCIGIQNNISILKPFETNQLVDLLSFFMHIIQELNPTPTQTSHCRNKITSVTAIANSTVSIFYLFP